MIENIDRLTPRDKLFMIYNKKSFSLPTSSSISFYENDWNKEIELTVHPGEIEQMVDQSMKIFSTSTLKSLTFQHRVPVHVQESIFKMMQEISEMPCETKENICDIIAIFGVVLKKIYLNSNSIPSWNGYEYGIVKYFFEVLLPWKLRAHEILVRTTTDILPSDKNLQEFYLKTLRCIIQEIICEKSTYEKMAILIYQVCMYLGLHEDSLILSIIIDSMVTMFNYNNEQLKLLVLTLFSKDTDSLHMIDNISDRPVSDLSNIIINDTRRCIEENYKKNKISTRIKNGGLCIGDDVFDNGGISVSHLLVELDKLSEDRLKDYIGENKFTSFEIPENDIGYLRLKEKLPVCKVMTKENGFYTLTRYDNKSYLLFKISGDSKCYGISFPSDFGGKRKVVMFDLPKNYEYIMTM